MSKNLIWSVDDLRKKGLVEKDGVYVPVKSLVVKNPKKIEPISDRMMAFKMAIDPYQQEDKEQANAVIFKSLDKVTQYLNRPNELGFVDELLEVAKYHGTKICVEKTTIKIKPLTQNRAWKGRRFKSDQYKAYASAVDLLLPSNLIIPEGLLKVYYEFGMSRNSDFDNPCKMFTDILQEKYKFNDSRIMEAKIKKVIVKKGEEYIAFKIESL